MSEQQQPLLPFLYTRCPMCWSDKVERLMLTKGGWETRCMACNWFATFTRISIPDRRERDV